MELKLSLKNYKILFLDLDGTLLDDNNNISIDNYNYLKKFKENGYLIVICTGRPLINVIDKCKEIFDKIDKKTYIIASNGAEILDFAENKILMDDSLSLNLVTKIWKYCEINKLFIFAFYNHKKHYFLINTIENIFDTITKQIIYHCEEFSCIPKVISADDIKINHYFLNKVHIINHFINPNLSNLKIINDIILLSNNTVDISSTSNNVFEITNKNINKGFGVKFICDKLNIPLKKTIVVGDNGNDLSMFKIAGLSATPKNGIDVAKKTAKLVLEKSNNENVVKELFLNLTKQ